MIFFTKNNNELPFYTTTVPESIWELYSNFYAIPIQIDDQLYLLTCIYTSCLLINKNNNEIVKKFSIFDDLVFDSGYNILFKLNDNNFLYAILNDYGNLIMTKFNLNFNNDNSIEIASQNIYEGE